MDAEVIKITRVIQAPLKAVWSCWSEAEYVSVWYGPGIKTVMHHFDFSEGGYWQEEMRAGENSMHGRSEFVEIIPGRKIVLHQSAVDAHGNIIANPMMPNWPEIMKATVMFADTPNGTEMQFSWTPHEASDEEIGVWNSMASKMSGGWEKGFDILEKEAQAIAKL